MSSDRIPGAFTPPLTTSSSPLSSETEFEWPVSTMALSAAAGVLLGGPIGLLAPLAVALVKVENNTLSELGFNSITSKAVDPIQKEVGLEAGGEKLLEVAAGGITTSSLVEDRTNPQELDSAGLPIGTAPLPVILGETPELIDEFPTPAIAPLVSEATPLVAPKSTQSISTIYASIPLSPPISPSREGQSSIVEAPVSQTQTEFAQKERMRDDEIEAQGGLGSGGSAAAFGIGPYADESVPFAPVSSIEQGQLDEEREADKNRHRNAGLLAGAAGVVAGAGAYELSKDEKKPQLSSADQYRSSPTTNEPVASSSNENIAPTSTRASPFTPSVHDPSRGAAVLSVEKRSTAHDLNKSKPLSDSSTPSAINTALDRESSNYPSTRESVALAAGAGLAIGSGGTESDSSDSPIRTSRSYSHLSPSANPPPSPHPIPGLPIPVHDRFENQNAELPRDIPPVEAGTFSGEGFDRAVLGSSGVAGGLEPSTFSQEISQLSEASAPTTVAAGEDVERREEIPPVSSSKKDGSDWERETLAAIGVGSGAAVVGAGVGVGVDEAREKEMATKALERPIRHETPQPLMKEVVNDSPTLPHTPNKLHRARHDGVVTSESPRRTSLDQSSRDGSASGSTGATEFSPHMHISTREDPTGTRKLHKSSHDSPPNSSSGSDSPITSTLSTLSDTRNSPIIDSERKEGTEVWKNSVANVVNEESQSRGSRPTLVTIDSEDRRDNPPNFSLPSSHNSINPTEPRRKRSTSISNNPPPSTISSTTLKKERRASHGSESSGGRKSGFLKKLFSTRRTSTAGIPAEETGKVVEERR